MARSKAEEKIIAELATWPLEMLWLHADRAKTRIKRDRQILRRIDAAIAAKPIRVVS